MTLFGHNFSTSTMYHVKIQQAAAKRGDDMWQQEEAMAGGREERRWPAAGKRGDGRRPQNEAMPSRVSFRNFARGAKSAITEVGGSNNKVVNKQCRMMRMYNIQGTVPSENYHYYMYVTVTCMEHEVHVYITVRSDAT